MSIHFITDFPAECTNKAWQKKKSFLDKAKSATKTGLGDALTTAEKKYALVDWKKLDAGLIGIKWRSVPEINEHKSKAQEILDGPAKEAARAIEIAASKARTTSTNAALSTTAKAAAKDISGKLLQRSAAIKGITLDDFDAQALRLQQKFALVMGNLKPKVLELERKLNDLERKPTVAEWTRLDVKNGFRSLGNALGNVPEFKDIWPIWKPWDGLQETRHPKLKGTPSEKVQKEAILEIIHEVRPELAKLKHRVGA